jgi:hypothetical protein
MNFQDSEGLFQERTFGEFQFQSRPPDTLEDRFQPFEMLCYRWSEDDDIVQVHKTGVPLEAS